MASLNPHNAEKEEDLKEALLDKQSTIDIPEGSRKRESERGTTCKQIIINIPEDLEPDPENTCLIHRVPENLRRICPEAYTPQLVSIGPLHYCNPNLKAMELHKTKYEQKFWNRDFCKHIPKGRRMEFMEEKGWLEKFQRSYAVTFELVDSCHFKRMILLDACFILELFLRSCEIQLNNKKMLSDGPVELHKDIKKIPNDYILRRPWLNAAIKQDLILLENQLPYFVFTDLYNFILNNKPTNQESEGRKDRHDFIIQIACEFFIDYYKFGKPPAAGAVAATKAAAEAAAKGTFLDINKDEDIIKCDKFGGIKHFTDLVRLFMRPAAGEGFDGNGVHCLYSATQLDRAGVNFVRRGNENAALTDIKNENAALTDIKSENAALTDKKNENAALTDKKNENAALTDIKSKDKGSCWWNGRCCCWIQGFCTVECLDLEVPELKVQDNTECIFRNVMALEQFVYPRDPYICNYVFLLDQLISTEEDVQFLVDKKIVSNWLGSNKAVVDLINKLCDQIMVADFFYNKLCEELNIYHEKELNAFRATLNRVFFKDLWTKCSTAVAIVFLIFSIFSTISTIKALFF